jgi:hypothetical protein
MAHLFEKYGMSEVDIRGCGVEPGLYLKGFVLFAGPIELAQKGLLADNLDRPPSDDLKLFFRREHGMYDTRRRQGPSISASFKALPQNDN